MTATWRADPTVLYITIALAFAAVAAAGIMGAYVWGRRSKPTGTSWQPAPSYARSTQTPTVQPTTNPNVEPKPALNAPNPTPDSPGPEENSAPKAED